MNVQEQSKSIIITGFVGLLVLVIMSYSYFMFGREQIKNFNVQAMSLQEETKKLKAELRDIKQTLSERSEIEKQAETIKKVTQRLPSSPDAPGFLNALIAILGTTGIFQEEVRPDATTDRSLYTEIPYKIKARGHFHALGQFLTLIEQNPDRFMRVKNLKLINDMNRPSIHPVEMDIVTFMFNQKNLSGSSKP